jgi:hypothetical protein
MARNRKSLPGYVDISLTDEQVDTIVEETIEAALSGKGTWHPAPTRGRPSLNGKPEPSPHVGFRVSPELRDQATELARLRGVTLSQLAREALEHYVSRT